MIGFVKMKHLNVENSEMRLQIAFNRVQQRNVNDFISLVMVLPDKLEEMGQLRCIAYPELNKVMKA